MNQIASIRAELGRANDLAPNLALAEQMQVTYADRDEVI